MKSNNRKRWGLWAGLAVGLIAIWAFFFFPMNSYIESPGEASDLKSFVSIKGHPDQQAGKFMLTSVALQRTHPFSYLLAKTNPHQSIESADDVTGGENSATFNKVQTFYMQSAINEAVATAFKSAKMPVTKDYKGIYVLQIQKNSPFKSQLAVGDTITKVNGRHFNSSMAYQKYIGQHRVGEKMAVTFEHDGKTKTVTNKLVKLMTKKAGIGIILTDNVSVKTTPTVKVDPGQIGGPSGGLMFSLQIYTQLTGQNLRHGQKIAGTGTINPDGSVGEIGGIDKKIIAARDAGATVFFAPYVKPSKTILKYEPDHLTNYMAAKKTADKYAPKMKVVPVKTFNEAKQYLETHH